MTMTVTTLRSLRSDSNYRLFYVKVTATAAQLGVHEAQFPSLQKSSQKVWTRWHGQSSFPYYTSWGADIFWSISTCITWRFDQPGYRMYRYIQELLKAARKEEYQTELTFVTDFWSKPLSTHHTSTSNLRNFTTVTEKSLAIAGIIKFLKKLLPAQ